MTPPSPLAGDPSLVTFTIKVEGEEIPGTVRVVSIETWSAVNKVPKARLVIFDGSAAESDFPLSAGKTFLPGNKVSIAAGYNSKETAVFQGIIVKQGIEINRTEGSKLVVDLTDEAIRMTLERRNALFEKVKDSDLIGKLITANGLAKDVAATNTEHAQVVQYYASDWDLMLTRAEMNGLVVTTEAGKVTVKPPDTQQTAVLLLEYGDSILDLGAEMDASTQVAPSAIQSATWDIATQKRIESGPGTVSAEAPGNFSSADLAKVFNVKKFNQQTGGPIETSALQDWSSAELLKSKLSKIRGYVTFQGSALARTGKTIELAGLGPRFNGTAWISGVRHSITNGVWLTTTDFGLSAQWFAAESPGIAAPDAAGQLPPIKGLQTGVVKQVAKDPDGEFRVLVTLPLLQDDAKGLWVRPGAFYASNNVGALFYPETGDEVVVGFMNEDPRYGVILGSVYSKKLPPPFPPDEQNTRKAIVTKGKLQITFDDKDKILQILTPAKQTITLDDKAGTVKVEDKNKNSLVMSSSGITLESASNLTLKAKANVTIEAGANLSATAKVKASMEAAQIEHKATGQFTAKASGMAEVSGSAMLTLKGALVKIN
jgi:Rhs element Vgr protein